MAEEIPKIRGFDPRGREEQEREPTELEERLNVRFDNVDEDPWSFNRGQIVEAMYNGGTKNVIGEYCGRTNAGISLFLPAVISGVVGFNDDGSYKLQDVLETENPVGVRLPIEAMKIRTKEELDLILHTS